MLKAAILCHYRIFNVSNTDTAHSRMSNEEDKGAHSLIVQVGNSTGFSVYTSTLNHTFWRSFAKAQFQWPKSQFACGQRATKQKAMFSKIPVNTWARPEKRAQTLNRPGREIITRTCGSNQGIVPVCVGTVPAELLQTPVTIVGQIFSWWSALLVYRPAIKKTPKMRDFLHARWAYQCLQASK